MFTICGERAFIKQRRAAMRTKAAHGLCHVVLVARDPGLAFCHPEALAPASDIGRIGRAMGAPALGRMIVPGPARRRVDLEADLSAQALTGGDADRCCCFCHFTLPSPSSLRGAEATKQSSLSLPPHGLLRVACHRAVLLRRPVGSQ